MTIKRDQSESTQVIAAVVNSATAQVEYLQAKDNQIIFDKGSGSSSKDNMGYGVLYGEWSIIPTVDFKAQVKIWGAGGGAHGNPSGAAGGGGHTYGDVKFYKGVPYVVWVGEGGFYAYHTYSSNTQRQNFRQATTFGGGGGAGHNGGGGGGLSGLFFTAAPTNGGPGHGFRALATTFRSPGQSTALLIAGGGGGEGHHNGTNHGHAGGGGGETANHGHAQAAANQHAGGHDWRTTNHGLPGTQFQGGIGGPTSYTGGGGGGWYGGPGGTQYSSHHNGGGGGSGHLLPNTTSGYPNHWIKEMYPNIVKNAASVVAPGVHGTINPAPAGITDPDYKNYAGYGAGNSTTFTPNLANGNNGRVLLKFKGFGDL